MSLPDVDTRSAVAVDHLLALAAVNTVSGLSQTVQIGALPLLIGLVLAERGSDPATIGLIAAAPWVAILLLSRFVPAVLRRVGLLRGVLIGVLLSAASVLAMGGSTHPALLFVLNAAVGAGLILRWIACDTWIVSIAPKAYRGRAIGVHETLMGLGIAAGPLVLAVTGTDGPWPTTACVLLLLAGLSALPMLRRWDRRGEDRGASETVSGLGGPWRMLRLIPVGLFGAFTAGFVETSSVSLLAVYAMDVGYTVLVATLLVASFGAGGTLLQLPIGWLGDRIGSRHAHALCAAIILAGAVLVPAVLPVVWLAAAVAFCWGGVIGGMNTLAVMEAGERASDGDMAGAMTAVAFFYTLGSVAGPPVSGALMRSWSVHGLMIAAGAVSVVFLATAAGLRRTALAEPGV